MWTRSRGSVVGLRSAAALSLSAVVVGSAPAECEVAALEAQAASTHGQISAAVTAGSLGELREIHSRLESASTSSSFRTDERQSYLLAYLEWRMAQLTERTAGKDRKKLLKQAQARLDRVLDSAPHHAEALALRGSVLGDRIEGVLSGMVLGPKVSASHDRAAELAPDNPRVALQRGIGRYFTPRQFGGGMEKAEIELRRACRLFEQAADQLVWPYWGRVDALAWLGKVLANTERLDEARSVYEEALALAPGHVWIRDELLAVLDR